VGSELMGSSSRFEKTVALCGRVGMMQFCVRGPRGDFFLRRGADRVKAFLCVKNLHGTREQDNGWPFLGLRASFPANDTTIY
jgi:hypothetical protein